MILLPAESAETVCVILLPVKSLGRKQIHTDSLSRNLFITHSSFGRTQEILLTALAEAKYGGQSRQDAKTSGLVYTM